MTTHCAARYQEVLKALAPRICIVEEAAEVEQTRAIATLSRLIGERIVFACAFRYSNLTLSQ